MKESTSGEDWRSGTEDFMNESPRNSSENPIISSPRFLLLLFLDIEHMNPTAINGMERTEMSAVKPRSEMIHAVTVVPMLAPMITPTAWVRVRSPAFTKLTTITVVALDDWMIAVMPSPVSTLLKGFDVMAARKDFNLSPAAF